MDGVSVVVCCYNSALKLPLTLEYLSKQKTDTLNWEIIVINNSSKDNTAEVAKKVWQSFSCKNELRIINEAQPGLSYARQSGIVAALYDIIVFCDDDNLLAQNYLQYCYELVNKTKNAGFGVWGGKCVAHFETGAIIPEWFEKESTNYVVGTQGRATGDISERGYVWGAGMIILKSIYLKIINSKFPSLLKDRTGSVLTSGGDSEICLRTLIVGHKLYYDENLVLHHYITKDKLTKAYNQRLINGFKASNMLVNKYKIFIYYISGRNGLFRLYYACVYSFKYTLSLFNIRALTSHDKTVLHALFQSKFHDADFDVMRGLLKNKNTNYI